MSSPTGPALHDVGGSRCRSWCRWAHSTVHQHPEQQWISQHHWIVPSSRPATKLCHAGLDKHTRSVTGSRTRTAVHTCAVADQLGARGQRPDCCGTQHASGRSAAQLTCSSFAILFDAISERLAPPFPARPQTLQADERDHNSSGVKPPRPAKPLSLFLVKCKSHDRQLHTHHGKVASLCALRGWGRRSTQCEREGGETLGSRLGT